ncbi:hypothetical protein AB0H71_20980 [Nocardia sp. NPDC050697]|uniref:hypothetical protein n=1 Tax=Nocardia sp. NPDC050697 TaxID=3155158 RepID=UPI0033F6A5AD
MDFVYKVLVVAHLLGMAAVVGGWVACRPEVNSVMVWGARAQLVTGIVLVGLAESIDSLGKDPNMVKIGVKLVIAVAVAGFAEVGYADPERGKRVAWMSDAAGGLAVVNVLVATLWS